MIPVTITHLTALGWITVGLSAAVTIPGLTSIRGLLSSLAGYAIGHAISASLGAITASVGGSNIWTENSGVGPVNSFTSSGNGLSFSSAQQAAIAALKYINRRSIKKNHEYVGNICKRKNGTFFYTKPYELGPTGNQAGGGSGNQCPGNTYDAGWYHSHGAWDPAVAGGGWGPTDGNEVFSPIPYDKSVSEGRKVPGWLATPTGRIYRYDPVSAGGPLAGQTTDVSQLYGRTPRR